VGSYRFINRLVPSAPAFLKDESKTGMVVQTDSESNSWVWIGSPLLGAQILELAKAYDIEQQEMDLEFVLLLMNSDRVRSYGVSFFYQQQASFLNTLSLAADASSLQISTRGGGVRFDLGDSQSGFQVLSQPVIRCSDGQPWSFSSDADVPVPRSDISEGVTRQSVEFKPSGFGLDGLVHVVGKHMYMKVTQRNGSISPATAASFNVPTFNNQKLTTTVALVDWKWSVLGGIQIDKETFKRGFFGKSAEQSSDYLIIFVRPRGALTMPPMAQIVPDYLVPKDDDKKAHPLLRDYSGVLPDRFTTPEEDEEIELINKELKIHGK